MLPDRETLLCRYHYDPLDRLVDCTPTAQASAQRFYLNNRLATEIVGATRRSIMQHDDQLLAQHQHQGSALETRLLATDQQRSVLNLLDGAQRLPIAYSPYGHRPSSNGLLSLLGFNGERADSVTGCYLLGNGYRAFNPVLMRFNSPDSWSPFGEGGRNTYAYCLGDPVNRRDPTGHTPVWLKHILRRIGLMRERAAVPLRTGSSTGGPFRNPMANLIDSSSSPPFSSSMPTKTPAWTTRGTSPFVATEGTPRSSIDPMSYISSHGNSPNASPVPTQRTRRMANIYEVGDTGEMVPLYGSSNSINSFDSASSRRGSIPDLPPRYSEIDLPTFERAMENHGRPRDVSDRQSLIRRN